MTPRQLLALITQHRVFNTGDAPEAVHATPRPSKKQGSAGWLLAVAADLNRHKAGVG
jgi:carotenoid cleavage dioxygenase-like enzyme